MDNKVVEATKELLYKMADDLLILGHRNSEWTGLGPILEEDIAFSSMAQDKIGQSQALYQILNELGESDPDTLAFTRNANQFHCCHLTEMPIGEYNFSLIRHFLFDHAYQIRFELLAQSTNGSLAKLSRKVKGEFKYHVFHADTFLVKLGNGTEESNAKMQSALDDAFGMALGIFEPSPFENVLIENGVFAGEKANFDLWLEKISPVIEKAGLKIPDLKIVEPIYGGRKGIHTEFLQPLVDEMSEVFRIDPSAEW